MLSTHFVTFMPGQQVLPSNSHQSDDGPNPKRLRLWRGPYSVWAQLSPVVYRVRPSSCDSNGVSVYLTNLKHYRANKMQALFIAKLIPLPALQPDTDWLTRIESYAEYGYDGGTPASTVQIQNAQLVLSVTVKRVWAVARCYATGI